MSGTLQLSILKLMFVPLIRCLDWLSAVALGSGMQAEALFSGLVA
jgi:hypothetical protein